MQFNDDFRRRSAEEYIKDNGLLIDYDEIKRKGKMSKQEALISKWFGVYQSKQTGTHMARIVVPGGKFSAYQGRVMAECSRKYSRGILNITTRQAIQLHFLKISNIPDFMRDLNKAELSTYHGCGDVTRIIAACPLAETCSYARHNVMPDVMETSDLLTKSSDLDNLPRKYKVTFSGCGANCAQPFMNCNGMIAVSKESIDRRGNTIEVPGYRVVIGGGMGWKAFVAEELFSFIPKALAPKVSRAIAIFYRDHGDRYNRAKSRLKFVVEKYGIDTCREHILAILKKEKVKMDQITWKPITEIGVPYPSRPLSEDDPIGDDGLATVRALIPKGEIQGDHLERLSELSEIYGNQMLYTDNRQNISVHGVEPKDVQALKQEIEDLGLKAEGSFGIRDIVSCVGKAYCPKAVTFTRDLFDLLIPLVHEEKYDTIQKRAIINITGCPNSCSPYRITDIGFRGMRISNEEGGSTEGYELLVAGHQEQHGIKLGEFKRDDCVIIVRDLLDLFLVENESEESLGDYVRRLGIEGLKERIL